MELIFINNDEIKNFHQIMDNFFRDIFCFTGIDFATTYKQASKIILG